MRPKYSVQQLLCCLDNQYKICVIGLTVSTATLIWAEQLVQQILFELYTQYNNCVIGWTVKVATLMWFSQTIQQILCGLAS